jgi:hypothetical protein
MKVQIGRNSDIINYRVLHARAGVCSPNSETRVQPTTILFPATRWHGIDAHENVCLAKFDRFPAINECMGSGALGKVHRDRVHLRLV